MIKVIGVRFRTAGKIYFFDPLEFHIEKNDHVIVETARGIEFGTVVSGIKEVEEEKVVQPLKPVLRIANERDVAQETANKEREKEAFQICLEKIREHGLEMKLIDAEYTFDNNKVLFYFTADGRIDFRELVKDLASVFKTRIELRQIGVRDETKIVGGIGICGRPLCCHSYLSDFVPVSIKMAKEQNLSLNPAKISGVCGRLMCCLKNEEETYEELNRRLPNIGDFVNTADGLKGEVQSVNVLRQLVKVIVNVGDEKEIKEYAVEQLQFRRKRGKKEKMDLTQEELEELERLEEEEQQELQENKESESVHVQHQSGKGRYDKRKFQGGSQENGQKESEQLSDGAEADAQRQGSRNRLNRNHQEGRKRSDDRQHSSAGMPQGDREHANARNNQGERSYTNAGKNQGEKRYTNGGSAQGERLYAGAGNAQGERSYTKAGSPQGERGYANAGNVQSERGYANVGSTQGEKSYVNAGNVQGERGAANADSAQGEKSYVNTRDNPGEKSYANAGGAQREKGYTSPGASQDERSYGNVGNVQGEKGYANTGGAQGEKNSASSQENRSHVSGNDRHGNRNYSHGGNHQEGRIHQNGGNRRRQDSYGYQSGRNRRESRNRYDTRGRQEGQSRANDNQTEGK